ncbi:hypothetical protein T484DRAFT_1841548 [Baffinella frigidus]|nr:hypothetical protein T484DRAFT_1841548 [Cryptophyta sp. CCMP2293]
MRHGNWVDVAKGTPHWVRRWAEALKPSGILLIVTIRTREVEHRVIPILKKHSVFLLQSRKFNNSGFEQCKYFLFRKSPLQITSASPPPSSLH